MNSNFCQFSIGRRGKLLKQFCFTSETRTVTLSNTFSANSSRYSANPLIFRSDSNSATLRFTSDNIRSATGILMTFMLSMYFCCNLLILWSINITINFQKYK